MTTSLEQQATPSGIIALAWPALVVLAATPLYLLWDTAVVGRLGAVELAGLAAGATVLSTVTTQLTFLSYGTTARAARHHGAGRDRDAVYEGVQASWVALGVGAVLASLVFGFAPQIMSELASDSAVVAGATEWIRVTCLSVIPALLAMAGNGWLRGLGNTRLPLWFTLAGVIPMAVTVPWSVSRWGLVGSAYANVLGEWIVAAGFLGALIVYWRRGDLTDDTGDTADRHDVNAAAARYSLLPHWPTIRRQLVLGRDLIIRSLSFQAAFLSAAAVAGSMGAASLAAHQVLLQLWNFLTLVLDSVAIAAQALVGAALGKDSRMLARSVGATVLRFSVAFSVLLAVLLAAGAHVGPRIFTHDPSVLAEISVPWFLLVVLVLLGGVVFALDGVLLGAADVAFLRTVSVVSVLVGFIPLVWLSRWFDWGLVGVWCGLVSFLALRCVSVLWRFRGDTWMDNGDTTHEEHPSE